MYIIKKLQIQFLSYRDQNNIPYILTKTKMKTAATFSTNTPNTTLQRTSSPGQYQGKIRMCKD